MYGFIFLDLPIGPCSLSVHGRVSFLRHRPSPDRVSTERSTLTARFTSTASVYTINVIINIMSDMSKLWPNME